MCAAWIALGVGYCTVAAIAGEIQPESWKTNMIEGHRLFGRGMYSQAQAMYSRALEEAERSGDTVRLAASLTALGAAQHQLALFDEAERLHRRALQLVGSDDPLAPLILTNLAGILLERGDAMAARELCESAHERWKKQFGEGDPHVGESLGRLAATFAAMGDYQRATALYSRALSHLEHSAGPNDRRTLMVLSGYATTVFARKDFKRAEKLWAVLLSRFETTAGPKHPDTLATVIALASAYVSQSKAECLDLYKRAVSDATQTAGKEDLTTTLAVIGYSSCLATVGRNTEALEQAQAALRTCESRGYPGYARTAALTNLAAAASRLARYPEAAARYGEVVAICAESNCAPAMIAKVLPAYAAVLRKAGQKDVAAVIERRLRASAADARSRHAAAVDFLDLRQVRDLTTAPDRK